MKILKKMDRTLLEMHTGMILFGIVCQIVGVFFAKQQILFAKSLWFGILLAIASSIHMGRTLDRALACGEAASKIIVKGYIIRYTIVAAFFIVISITQAMNPLIAFLGYMSMKVTAYLQPLTHRIFNKMFHETDPIPEPIPEEKTVETDEERGENLNE